VAAVATPLGKLLVLAVAEEEGMVLIPQALLEALELQTQVVAVVAQEGVLTPLLMAVPLAQAALA
jgi:hypothetical protein